MRKENIMNRIGIRIAIIAVIVVGAAGYKLFFVDSDEVRNFNDELVGLIQRSDERFTIFTKHVKEYCQGKKVDLTAMRAQREILAGNIRSDLNKLKKTAVPDDELCKEFHGSCTAYVDNSLNIAEKYEEVIAYISQHNPGKEGDFAVVEEPLAELLQKDEQMFDATAAIQLRMAKKFDFKVQ